MEEAEFKEIKIGLGCEHSEFGGWNRGSEDMQICVYWRGWWIASPFAKGGGG